MQYQKASAELKRLARVLRAYEWTDHRAKVVARKEVQFADGNSKLTRPVARRNDWRARLVLQTRAGLMCRRNAIAN